MTLTHTTLEAYEIRELNAEFETAQPADILAWAAKNFVH